MDLWEGSAALPDVSLNGTRKVEWPAIFSPIIINSNLLIEIICFNV